MSQKIIFEVIFKYFWLIGVIVNIFNLIYMLIRIKRNTNEMNIKNFIIRFSSLMILPFLLLGIYQIMGEYNNPFYIISKQINIFVILSWITLLYVYCGLFFWINFRNGLKELIYVNKNNLFYSELISKVVFNVMLVVTPIFIGILVYSDIYLQIEEQITNILK